MITRVEALGYRSLRYVDQDLAPFMILAGPNASGKSTFLDAINFISDSLRDGVPNAVQERAEDVASVFWNKTSTRFEIAVEVEMPDGAHDPVNVTLRPRARYEVAIGIGPGDTGEIAVADEALWVAPLDGDRSGLTGRVRSHGRFPAPPTPPPTILQRRRRGRAYARGRWVVLNTASGGAFYSSERRSWRAHLRLPRDKLALAGLPEDRARFPAALWVRDLLLAGIQRVFLSSDAMRQPSTSGTSGGRARYLPDGSNLPWIIDTLRKDAKKFSLWLSHVRTALPDIEDIRTFERPEDRTRFLLVRYKNGVELPSWSISDGTLRLLALTLIAYIDETRRVYLVEEPENGIHPQAIEIAYQSLSSAYSSQVLCTSHSPMVLTLAEPAQILCFSRDATGATDVVRGDRHPLLLDWRRRTDLGTLFAAGVLG